MCGASFCPATQRATSCMRASTPLWWSLACASCPSTLNSGLLSSSDAVVCVQMCAVLLLCFHCNRCAHPNRYNVNFYNLLNDQLQAPWLQYQWMDATLASARDNNEKVRMDCFFALLNLCSREQHTCIIKLSITHCRSSSLDTCRLAMTMRCLATAPSTPRCVNACSV